MSPSFGRRDIWTRVGFAIGSVGLAVLVAYLIGGAAFAVVMAVVAGIGTLLGSIPVEPSRRQRQKQSPHN
jgi:hypothetical protein